MASYEVRFTKSAEKDLRKVERARLPSIMEKIEGLGEEPRPPGCQKLVGSEASYRIRVGDYRVVYAIDDGIRIVEVARVRHRREAYR